MDSAQSDSGAAAGRRLPRHRAKGRRSRQITFRTICVPPRLKRALLIGASGLALAAGTLSVPPALALNECGAGAPGGSVTCTPAGNNFPNGIEYQVTDLTIVVQDGVIVDTTGGGVAPGGISSGGTGSYGDLVIKAGTGGGSGVVITTDEAGAEGIYARSNDGSIAITSFSTITTKTADGIVAWTDDGTATVTSVGDIAAGGGGHGILAVATDGVTVVSTGAIEAAGDAGIFATSEDGLVSILSTGTVTVSNDYGISGYSNNGAVAITSVGDITTTSWHGIRAVGETSVSVNSTGDIATSGLLDANGIFAQSTVGDVAVISAGDISTASKQSEGISALALDGAVTVQSTGDIETLSADSTGILARAEAGTATVISSGAITTHGDAADGIYAVSFTDGVTVTSAGNITTAGSDAEAILASGSGAVTVVSVGNLATGGKSAEAIVASAGIGDAEITSTGNITTGGDEAIAIRAGATGNITLKSNGDITTAGQLALGISAFGTGDVTITSVGDITTNDLKSTGILAQAEFSGSGEVTVSSTGAITTKGSTAINAIASSGGALSVTSIGNISVGAGGTEAHAISVGGGPSSKVTSVGNLDVHGDKGSGIHVFANGDLIIDSTGAVTTDGVDGSAIYGKSFNTAVSIASVGDIATGGTNAVGIQAIAPGAIEIESTGAIATLGASASAISATSDAGSIVITSDGALSTEGISADGIFAQTNTADIVVGATGDIATAGLAASGIQALANGGAVTVQSTGNITTQGDEADGILAVGGGDIVITSVGAVRTSGAESHAIEGDSSNGDITISAGTAIASGKDARGIDAAAPSASGVVSIVTSGAISGGWGSGAGIATDGIYAASVEIKSGSTVGALSDRAMVGGAEITTVTNHGTITGSVALGDGNDSFSNISANSFNLRNFADTDGDGVRDTEAVAIADFGADSDAFENSGTLRLAGVAGATAFNTGGQIAHPGGGNSDIAQQGVEQGFLINLEAFNHSGLITMQDGVAGDLLVITDQADGATAGNNVFTSNGGALALDVVLDDGSSGRSDALILDKALAGTGATQIFVANAGGIGGKTSGDGILVVNVRTESDEDAFTLANRPTAGAYQYDLYFQNLAGTDENWYLRSSFFEGALEYPAIVSSALVTWYSDLGSLHDQLGKRRALTAAQDAARVTARQTAELPTATDIADAGWADEGSVRRRDSGQGGWMRAVGSDLEIDQDSGADFDLETVRAEAGFDVGFGDLFDPGDWLLLGGLAGYGVSEAAFDSGNNADFDIATVGAYATYFRGPYYLDALVKLDYLDGSFSSDAVQEGDVELPVLGLSLETGYRFDLTQGGLYLQPQAQLSYAHAWGDSFRDDSGARIALDDADSLRGRLAARLGQELGTTAGVRAAPVEGNFYFEAAVNQEFLGESNARISGLTLDQDLPETTFEVGAGFDIALPKDGVAFTVDADYVFGDEIDGVAATAGIRINW